MVDKSDIADKIAKHPASDAAKAVEEKTSQIESARQFLKNQIIQSGLSALDQSRIADEVDRMLNGASQSLVPININQFIAGLTSKIKQEIADEKAAENKVFITQSALISAYDAIKLSAEAHARINRLCASFNPHNYESLHHYAAGIVDQSLPPLLKANETEALADFMMNDPEGKEAAQRLAHMSPEEKKKRFESVERAKEKLSQMAKDPSLSEEQREKLQGAIHNKLYGNPNLRAALEKYTNGEIDINALMKVEEAVEDRHKNKTREHANNHHTTKQEQAARVNAQSCGYNVCSAKEDVDIYLEHEKDPVWMAKAKSLAEQIMKNGMDGIEQPDVDMAFAYIHHHPDIERQFISDVTKNQINEKAQVYNQAQTNEKLLVTGQTRSLPSNENEFFSKNLALMQTKDAEHKDARINSVVDVTMQNAAMQAYNQRYKGQVQKTIVNMEESGDLEKMIAGVAATMSNVVSTPLTAVGSTVNIVTSAFNTNKVETDKISTGFGRGVRRTMEDFGFDANTAQDWGHSATEKLKAGAAKKDEMLKSVSEKASAAKDNISNKTSSLYDSVSSTLGHNTLGNQIDKNLAAINKSGTFSAVTDGNGKKIFNLDGKEGISKEELIKVLEKHGITDLKQLDKNGDGLSQGELIGAMNKIMQQERAAGTAKKIEDVANKLIDKDFAKDLKNSKITFTKEEIKIFDANGDGKLDINDKDKIMEVLKKKGVDLNGFDKDKNGIDMKELGEAMHAAATPASAKKQQQPAKAH